MVTTTKAFSYIRFSSAQQAAGDSLRRQTAATEAYCQRHGLTLDKTLNLKDLGISAYKGKNLSEGALGGFLQAVREGKVAKGSILLVESLDRLSRDQVVEALQLFLSILNAGITLVTLTPEQRFEPGHVEDMHLMLAIADMQRSHSESAMKSHRIGKSWEAKRANLAQRKLTGKCPAWLKLSADKTTFEKIPSAVHSVQRIYSMAIEGMGVETITRTLNGEGVPSIGRAKYWGRSYVIKLLKTRAVLGEFQPHKMDGKTRKPTGDVLPNYFPAIITLDDFYRAQQSMNSRKQAPGPRGKHVANLFTGLVHDSFDSSNMVYISKDSAYKSGQWRYLVSSKALRGERGSKYLTVPYPVFEQVLLSWIRELRAEDVTAVKTADQEIKQALEAAQGELTIIKGKIAATKKRAVSGGNGNFEAILDIVTDLDQKRVEVKRRVERLQGELASARNEALEETQSVLDLLGQAEGEDLLALRSKVRQQLRNLIDDIWVKVQPKGSSRDVMTEVIFKSGIHRRIGFTTHPRKPVEVKYSFEYSYSGTPPVRPKWLHGKLEEIAMKTA